MFALLITSSFAPKGLIVFGLLVAVLSLLAVLRASKGRPLLVPAVLALGFFGWEPTLYYYCPGCLDFIFWSWF
jgi:hypothetical protein